MTVSIPPIRILGIDPGLRITVFGVLDKVGQQLFYVASGLFNYVLRLRSMSERLRHPGTGEPRLSRRGMAGSGSAVPPPKESPDSEGEERANPWVKELK